MKQPIEQMLTRIFLFKDLSDSEVKAIAKIVQTKTIEKGTHVFRQGEKQEAVYFIEEGVVKTYRTDIQGREQIVSLLKEGEMFPHIGFFHKVEYPASAVAVKKTKLLYLLLSNFEQVLLSLPQIAIKLYKVMGEKIIELQQRLEAQMLNDTSEQLIKLLLRFGQKYGEKLADGYTLVHLPLTNKEIAQMIGQARETVSRTITKMKNEKLVESPKKEYYLFSYPQLLNKLINDE